MRAGHLARRPRLGQAMVVAAATLFALNASVAKVVLGSGLPALRLAELRAAGAAAALLLLVAATRPRALRVSRSELPTLALLGVGGLALVHMLYFVAIERLAIGLALLLQYLAPLLVAVWARLVQRRPASRRLWVALALALVGLALVVGGWGSGELDGIGVAAGLGAAAAFAAYFLVGERVVATRDAISSLLYALLFALCFWTVAQPWWSFPGGELAGAISLDGRLAGTTVPVAALVAWIVVGGTVVPFVLIVGALRHVSPTRAAIVAMVEPVLAAAVAWAWLGEALGPVELMGGLVVLLGIALAQTARSVRAS